MATQAPVKPTWPKKVQTFAAMYAPLTTRWDDFRSFREVEGFLEVYWPAQQGKCPPLIEIDQKPRCACCGSKRPMFLRYLTDRTGAKHLVGNECCRMLIEARQLRYLDLVMPHSRPDSEDKAG